MSAKALPPIKRDTESRIIESLFSSDGSEAGASLPPSSGAGSRARRGHARRRFHGGRRRQRRGLEPHAK